MSFPLPFLQSPSEDDRQRIRERVDAQIAVALRKRNCRPGSDRKLPWRKNSPGGYLGLGFLDLLLPPARTDISEITIYSSGLAADHAQGFGALGEHRPAA